MNLDSIPPSWYRLKLREYLQRKSESAPPRSPSPNEFIIADTFSSRGLTRQPPAPQGLGEMKHPSVDQNRGDTSENSDESIKEIDAKDDRWMAQDAYEYLARGTVVSAETRRQMEDHVRRLKWQNRACVHCSDQGLCSRVYIRCGDRMQYASRETKRQQVLPHECYYHPGKHGTTALVVDRDEPFREFCRNALMLFLDRSKVEVITTPNAEAALAVLNRCKVEGRRCGLVITEIGSSVFGGFELVNELYERNFTARVLLTTTKDKPFRPPRGYRGSEEIVPGQKLVSNVLPKPFHSEMLIEELKKTGW